MYAATHEGALHLDDVLARRTRISIETPSRGAESARAVADIVAPVLGWDAERVEAEVSAYIARVEAELESQKELADSEANAERLSAPDARRIPVSRAPEVLRQGRARATGPKARQRSWRGRVPRLTG